MGRFRLVVAALVLALAQIGFLSWFIVARAAVLRDGREVSLKVVPVDPRDLLRGDYVSLRYDVSSIPAALVTNIPAGAERLPGREIHVRLKQQPDGSWQVASARLGVAPDTAAGADEVDVRGYLGSTWNPGPGNPLQVTYGIERYYVPESEGGAIEDRMRERTESPGGEGTTNAHSFNVVAAVGRDGGMQIKRLMEDGKTLFEEPLY